MVIKEISTQGKDATGQPLYLIRDSRNYPAHEWANILCYLRRNADAGLLKFEIVAS